MLILLALQAEEIVVEDNPLNSASFLREMLFDKRISEILSELAYAPTRFMPFSRRLL